MSINSLFLTEQETRTFILINLNMIKTKIYISARREKSFITTGTENKKTKVLLVTSIETGKHAAVANSNKDAQKVKKVEVSSGILTRTFLIQ